MKEIKSVLEICVNIIQRLDSCLWNELWGVYWILT
jgi:hypothetical protein